jgi:hypothetical protein
VGTLTFFVADWGSGAFFALVPGFDDKIRIRDVYPGSRNTGSNMLLSRYPVPYVPLLWIFGLYSTCILDLIFNFIFSCTLRACAVVRVRREGGRSEYWCCPPPSTTPSPPGGPTWPPPLARTSFGTPTHPASSF